jgi:hypothetical protein
MLVCGAGVEVKSFRSLDERRGHAPTAESVYNKLVSARRQARNVVVYGVGSGLEQKAVYGAMLTLFRSPHAGHFDGVRAVGDGFDIGWQRQRVVDLTAGGPGRPPRQHGQQLGR